MCKHIRRLRAGQLKEEVTDCGAREEGQEGGTKAAIPLFGAAGEDIRGCIFR